MPLERLPVAVTPSTLTRVLAARLTPVKYALTVPFLTVTTSKGVPWSVMAEPALRGGTSR
jgi:hypothetical protein